MSPSAKDLPTVPTPAKGTRPHTMVPTGITEQTAWTPWARSLASVPVRQVPEPQEPTLPPALPQNVTLPWWCLALLQLLLGLDPVRSSGLQHSQPVPEPRVFAVSPPCLQCTQPRRLSAGSRGAKRGGGGGGHGMGTASTVAALCWQRCAGPAMSLSLQSAAVVPTSFPLHLLTACRSLLNTGTALEPSQSFPSALPLAAPYFPTVDLPSSATSFPRACPHILFSQKEPPWAVSPLLPQAQILPPALQGWPCHLLTSTLQAADRAGNT